MWEFPPVPQVPGPFRSLTAGGAVGNSSESAGLSGTSSRLLWGFRRLSWAPAWTVTRPLLRLAAIRRMGRIWPGETALGVQSTASTGSSEYSADSSRWGDSRRRPPNQGSGWMLEGRGASFLTLPGTPPHTYFPRFFSATPLSLLKSIPVSWALVKVERIVWSQTALISIPCWKCDSLTQNLDFFHSFYKIG